jgi:polyphosphate kinase
MRPDLYINRDLALLDFQERVLGLARHPDMPLLERVKYLAIVSSNLDEFFQVRVAGIREQEATGFDLPSPDGMTPGEQLEAIRTRVVELNTAVDDLYGSEIQPLLDKSNLRIDTWDELDSTDRAHLADQFEHEIFPVLTPLAVDPMHPFPYISDLSLNLAVYLEDGDGDALSFARVKVPPLLPRFFPLRESDRFILLEDVIAHHLDRIFAHQIVNHFVFRVTRNADLAVEEEAEDLLEAMETVLHMRRRSADAVRLEVGEFVDDAALELLVEQLGLSERDVYRRTTPLGLVDLWSLYGSPRPELKDPRFTPTTQARLAEGYEGHDFFDEISRGDVFVHHPYESFATSTSAFIAQAAADPDVLAIKQTLYRTSAPTDPALGGEAAVVRSLMNAAAAGKQVVVLVELKARFDEAANINWAKVLETGGVHVIYGVEGLKTHCKILLVVRREHGKLRRYAHVGTGNYNPNTARIYEDIGIFTADPDIGADLSELFNSLTGYPGTRGYQKLLVAPVTLLDRFIALIRREAERGEDGWIMWKLNHLVEPAIVEELYAAAEKGCRVDLIIRGMNSIRAKVPGVSETVRVRSIVGRYLEHSRIYRFGHPDDDAVYYVGSADMMPRNLHRRVEALMPVTGARSVARIEEILNVLWADDELAYEMQPDGSWERVPVRGNVNAHLRLQALAIERSREEHTPR